MNIKQIKRILIRTFLPWKDKEYQMELQDRKAMRNMWNSMGTDFVGRLIRLPWKDISKIPTPTYALTVPIELVDHLKLKVMKTYDLNISEVIPDE